ncbi:MAG: autotransporter outer membrane beta-barrel domain-containing protein, partial [Gammaproteobacteria bacterium]|nr:autotransporter outer membrane beta-barrel domain-containing protein [Gammaproteobacteria bacterium]
MLLAALLSLAVSAVHAGTPPPMMMPYGNNVFAKELCDFEVGPMSLEDENPDAFCPKFHPGDRTTNKDVGNLVNIIAKPISDATGGVSGGRLNSNIGGGVAAGDFGENYGWWVNYTRTTADDTLAITRYDGTLNTVVAGLDTTINDNLVIGVAFVYENHNYDTRMNGGTQDVEGFSGAPYVGWFINDNFSFDATVGYGGFDVEQVRVNSITAVATDLVRGDTDQDRWFVAANLNGFTRVGDFILSGRFGLLYTELDTDTINEVDLSFAVGDPSDDAFVTPSTNIEIGQISFGGEVAYSAFALE